MDTRSGLASLALVLLPLGAHGAAQQPGSLPGDPRIPAAVRAEHQELQEELARATKLRGPVGDAARELARLLHPHFVREEQVALPELGVLLPLSRGDLEVPMADIVPLADTLRVELPGMLREHAAIAAAARALGDAARRAGQPEFVRFAAALQQHARMEEQVLYPAAILAGQLVKGRLAER